MPKPSTLSYDPRLSVILIVLFAFILTACERPVRVSPLPPVPTSSSGGDLGSVPNSSSGSSLIPPTPDPTRVPGGPLTEIYFIQNGDTLGGIALEYNTTVEHIAQLNGLADLASISVGQQLHIPVEDLTQLSPLIKIVPDGELVYGPSTVGFDIATFVAQTNGYLGSYVEEIDGESLSGAQILQRVAERYSVGPRVLLALIEYRGGWLSNPVPGASELYYPAGHADERFAGLHKQLMWAADHLNAAYYGWKERGKQTILLNDFTRARIAPGLNAGSIALQSLLAFDSTADQWRSDTSPDGFLATYLRWFGDPFAHAVEPLIPPGLTQPVLTLPWPSGQTWYYTGGPHGGWGSGSAWAAIDFVAPDDQLGCYTSEEWVTSMSEGVVVRSRTGEVVVDLDGDGYEQTGWAILYMHIETRDRVAAGARVRVGDRIGHPSCEGGYSTATHMHLARRYNGEWIAAAGALPFVIEGWATTGSADEYSGWLEKNGERKEACECRDDAVNGIAH